MCNLINQQPLVFLQPILGSMSIIWKLFSINFLELPCSLQEYFVLLIQIIRLRITINLLRQVYYYLLLVLDLDIMLGTQLIRLGIQDQGTINTYIIRIFTSFIYGGEVFTAHDYWFWIPIVAPFIGAIIGSYFYKGCVGIWGKVLERI